MVDNAYLPILNNVAYPQTKETDVGTRVKHHSKVQTNEIRFDVHRAVHRNVISIVKSTVCTSVSNLFILERHSTFFDILLTVHLNIFILILTNLMH